MTKVFLCDLGWRGGLVVLAESRELAFEKVKAYLRDNDYEDIVFLDDSRLKCLGDDEIYRFWGDE